MKKYQVPARMLNAAVNAIDEEGRIFLSSYPHWPGMEACLRLALSWLSENPIVPTLVQAEEMRDSGHPCILDGAWYATEWQRRMFIATDPLFTDHSQDFIKTISGYTFTPEEATKIKRHIDDCTHPGGPAFLNSEALAEFEKKMETETVPAIVKAVEERQEKANEFRGILK